MASTFAGANGAIAARGQVLDLGAWLRPGAWPGWRRGSTGNSSSSQLVAKYSGVSKLSLGLSSSPPSPRCASVAQQARERRVSPFAAERTAAGNSARSTGSRSPAIRTSSSVSRGEAQACARARRRRSSARSASPRRIRPTSLARSATGSGVMCAQARARTAGAARAGSPRRSAGPAVPGRSAARPSRARARDTWLG